MNTATYFSPDELAELHSRSSIIKSIQRRAKDQVSRAVALGARLSDLQAGLETTIGVYESFPGHRDERAVRDALPQPISGELALFFYRACLGFVKQAMAYHDVRMAAHLELCENQVMIEDVPMLTAISNTLLTVPQRGVGDGQ